MIGGVIVFGCLLYAFGYFVKNAFERPKNFPPGPPRLPVYGAYWIVMANGFQNLGGAMLKLAEKYKTKVLGMYYGAYLLIVVNDPHLVKEVLNNPDFDGRNDIILARMRSYWKKLGIFFTDGYFWFVQRRFAFRYLRDYGFGKRDQNLETTMSNDIRDMLDMALTGPKNPAEKEVVNGDLIYLGEFFAAPFINAVLLTLAQITIPRSENKFLFEMHRHAILFQRGSDDLGGALSLTPWLKDFFPKWSGYKQMIKGNQFLLEFFEKVVKEAIETFDEAYDRHFLDMYIRKMKEEVANEKKSTYSVDQLVLTCVDFMFPAATAPQTVISLLIERMLLQPEIQEKIHEEIDRVVGRERLPNLDDRKNMPYTESCIREIMRYDTLVPLSVPHRAVKDTTFDGYNIPENTVVSPNFISLHKSKDIWGDPENFRPERFIKDGKLNVSSDKSLPFGAGKRLCAGETFARQSLFQVFASFMQTFKVSTADGKPLKKPAKRIQGIITTIPEFWVRVTPRT